MESSMRLLRSPCLDYDSLDLLRLHLPRRESTRICNRGPGFAVYDEKLSDGSSQMSEVTLFVAG